MRGRREEKEASQVFFPEGGGWGDPPESFIHCTAFSCENMITNFLPSFSHVNQETKTEHSVTKVCTMAFLAGHRTPGLGAFLSRKPSRVFFVHLWNGSAMNL